MTLAIVSLMRLGSTRFPNKMLAKVGSKTLAELSFQKITEAVDRICGARAYAVLYPKDMALMKLALEMVPIKFAQPENASAERIEDVHAGHDELFHAFDTVLYVNPCMPFLTVDTIVRAANKATYEKLNGTTVFINKGIVWDEWGSRVIGDTYESINTKTNPMYFTPAHAAYWYPRTQLGTPLMRRIREHLILQPGQEFIDVDVQEDLEFANIVYKGMQHVATVLPSTG